MYKGAIKIIYALIMISLRLVKVFSIYAFSVCERERTRKRKKLEREKEKEREEGR